MRIAILSFLLSASPIFATSFAMPKRHDVFSQNRSFVLDVNPETSTHTVYDVRDRTKPLWSFSYDVWHFPFLVSDSGQVVAVVDWMYVREQDIAAMAVFLASRRAGNVTGQTINVDGGYVMHW